MDIHSVVQQARKSISSFCIEECKSLCCRKGYLPLSEKETPLVTQGTASALFDSGRLRNIQNGFVVLNLSSDCPSLKEGKCSIHAHPSRPQICKDFPLFIEGNTVRMASGCTAVKNNLFFAYEKKFIHLGYTPYTGDVPASQLVSINKKVISPQR